MQALNQGFEQAVLKIARELIPSGYEAMPNAPSSLQALSHHVKAGNRMIVSSLNSDQTIYSSPPVNHAFRAWHDWCHVLGSAPFTLEGEYQVYWMQAAQLAYAFPGLRFDHEWFRILFSEVIGQAVHEDVKGYFPADQRAFVSALIRKL